MILALVFGISKGTVSLTDIVLKGFTILPSILLIQAIMIPLQLKFGGEKGRIILLGMTGLFIVIGIITDKTAQMFGFDIAATINNLPAVSLGAMIAVITAASTILLLISLRISISIMKHKEF